MKLTDNELADRIDGVVNSLRGKGCRHSDAMVRDMAEEVIALLANFCPCILENSTTAVEALVLQAVGLGRIEPQMLKLLTEIQLNYNQIHREAR